MPVLLNAVLIVSVAVAFNLLFEWRRYPLALAHRPGPEVRTDDAPTHDGVVDALRSLDSFVDISEDDLLRLIDLLDDDRFGKRIRSGTPATLGSRSSPR